MTTTEQHRASRKSADQIQAEIDLIRLAYTERMIINQPRRDRMVGWCLLLIALVVPSLAALVILI